MKRTITCMLCIVLLIASTLSAGCNRSFGEEGVNLCCKYLDCLQAGDYAAAYDLLRTNSRNMTDTHDAYSVTYSEFSTLWSAILEKYGITETRYSVLSTVSSKIYAVVACNIEAATKDGGTIRYSLDVTADRDADTGKWGIVWKWGIMEVLEQADSEAAEAGKRVCQDYLNALQRGEYAAAYALLAEDSLKEGMTASAFESMFDTFFRAHGITKCSFEVTKYVCSGRLAFAVYRSWYMRDDDTGIVFTSSLLVQNEHGRCAVIWDPDLDPNVVYTYAYGVLGEEAEKSISAEKSDAAAYPVPDLFDVQTGDELMAALLSRKGLALTDAVAVQLGNTLEILVPADWEKVPDDSLDEGLSFKYDGTDANGMAVSLCAYAYDFGQSFEVLQAMADNIDPNNHIAPLNGREVLIASNENTANLFFLTEDGVLLAIVFGGAEVDFHELSLSTKLVDDMTDIVHSIEFIG